jgi:hypothetical protein
LRSGRRSISASGATPADKKAVEDAEDAAAVIED